MTPSDADRTRSAVGKHVWRLLGLHPTARSRAFVRNVAYLAGTDAALSALTFFATAWLIRRLGPEEFGIASLVATVGLFCLVPALFGLPWAAMHHLAASRAHARCVGSTLLLAVLLPGAVLPVLAVSGGWMAPLLRIEPKAFAWGVLFAVPLAATVLSQSLLSGLQRFRQLAALQAVAGVAFFAAVLTVLAVVPLLDSRHYLGLTAFRWLLLGALVSIPLLRLAGRPSLDWCVKLLRLGSYHAASGLAHLFALTAINSVILNAYHGAASVGLYSAYFAVFNIFVSRFMKIVSDVLQPSASVTTDAAGLLRPILRAFGRAAAPLVVVTTGSTWALFQVYGPGYVFGWVPALLMAVGVTLSILNGLLADLLAASGLRGGRTLAGSAWATAVVNVVLNLALVPAFDVTGTLAATVGAVSITVVLRVWALRALSRKPSEVA